MRSNNKGFSLIELIVALGVIAVITSLGASFLSGMMRDSAYRSRVAEGRHDLKQFMGRLGMMMTIRDPSAPVIVTPTSLTMAVAREGTTPVIYDEVQIRSLCRAEPGGGAGFVIGPNSKGQTCYDQLACASELPYVEVRHAGHPTKPIERLPNDEQFSRIMNSEYALAGLAICVQDLPSSYTVKGIAAITTPSGSGQRTIQLIEESLILPKSKRNEVNIVPH